MLLVLIALILLNLLKSVGNAWETGSVAKLVVFNRPSVATAVLQTVTWLSNRLISNSWLPPESLKYSYD